MLAAHCGLASPVRPTPTPRSRALGWKSVLGICPVPREGRGAGPKKHFPVKHLPHAWPPRHLSLQLGKWDRVTPADTEHCGRPFLAPGSAPFGVCALLISNGGCPRRHTLHQAEGYLRPNPISTRTPVITHRGRRNSQTPFYNLLFGAAPEAKGHRLDPLKPTVHQRPASWGSLGRE